MRAPRVGCALAVLLAALAAEAGAAQVCVGRVLPAGERAVVAQAAAVRYDLETLVDGTDVGAAYQANPAGPLGYSLGYLRRAMEEGPADLDLLRAGASWELPLRFPAAPAPEVCATADAYGAWLGDAGPGTEYASYALPLGFSVGVPVPIGAEGAAAPFLRPRLLLVRSEGRVLGIPVEEGYGAVEIEGGVGIRWRSVLARFHASAARLPEDAGVGPVPHLRAGLEVGVRF